MTRIVLLSALLLGCAPDVGSASSRLVVDGGDAGGDAGDAGPEAALVAAIEAWEYDNITLRLEASDGRLFSYTKGAPDPRYVSHSTSKPVTMRVVLDLVDQGLFDVHALVTDLLPGYQCSQEQCRTEVHHLLSFQSSFLGGTKCWRDEAQPDADGSWRSAEFLDCVNGLNTEPINDPTYPNGTPKYIGQNLDVLTAIAMVQVGLTVGDGEPVPWDYPDSLSGGPAGPDGECGTADDEVSVWARFQCRHGLFMSTVGGRAEWSRATNRIPTGAYTLEYTADEYLDFMRSVRDCTGWASRRLCVMMQNDQLAHTTSTTRAYDVQHTDGSRSEEDWHMGYLLWLECESPAFDCVRAPRTSTIGIGGQYAVIDHDIGVIFVTSGPIDPIPPLGSLIGTRFYRYLEPQVRAWALGGQ